MKLKFNKKSIACLALVGAMTAGMSMTAFAGSGSQYGYANFRIDWRTTDTSASATAVSGGSATTIDVAVMGDVYDGDKKIDSFFSNNSVIGKNSVAARDTRKPETIKNGAAEAHRYSDGQHITTVITN